MPIKKNSDDYIDDIQQEITAQFGILFPKQKIKKILDQFQKNMYYAIKDAKQIEIPRYFTITPSLPLLRSTRSKYYNVKSPTTREVDRVKKIARNSSKSGKSRQ